MNYFQNTQHYYKQYLIVQVRRKSSTETATIESLINDSRVPDSVFTFSEEEIGHTQNKGDNSIQNDTLAENEGMIVRYQSCINGHVKSRILSFHFWTLLLLAF
jgi:hypothetical protein